MRIRQLKAISGEDLDSVVSPRIVRGRDNYARVKLPRAREIRDSGRGDHACTVDFHAKRHQSRSDPVRDPSAGFARVLANDYSGARVCPQEVMPQCASDHKCAFGGQRELARNASNAVGSKESTFL